MATFPDFHLDFYVSMRMAPRQVMAFHGEDAVLTVRAPFNAYAYGDQVIEIREADGRVVAERFGLAEQYRAQMERQLATLPRAEIARAAAADCGAIVVCKTIGETVSIADAVAPEHLEILTKDPETVAAQIKNARRRSIL